MEVRNGKVPETPPLVGRNASVDMTRILPVG